MVSLVFLFKVNTQSLNLCEGPLQNLKDSLKQKHNIKLIVKLLDQKI